MRTGTSLVRGRERRPGLVRQRRAERDGERAPPSPGAPVPPWVPVVREGQQALADGRPQAGAAKLFKDAFDQSGGHGVPRTMLEHVAVAIAARRQAARATSPASRRPRAYDLAVVPEPRRCRRAARRSRSGPHGAGGHVDRRARGRRARLRRRARRRAARRGAPVDVTPEAVSVLRPELYRAGDQLVLVVRRRARAPRPACTRGSSTPTAASPAPPSPSRPPKAAQLLALARACAATARSSSPGPTRSTATRRTSSCAASAPTLEPQGDVVRATDLVPAGPSKPRARCPSLAVAANALQVAFRLERDPLRLIEHLRLPLADAAKGLAPPEEGRAQATATSARWSLVNTDKSKADVPSLACGGGSCFVAWHGEQGGGAWAACIDPAARAAHLAQASSRARAGTPPWSRRADGPGAARLVRGRQGRDRARITRDGVGAPTQHRARQRRACRRPRSPRGTKPGEWYFAWLDYETGHLEAYAARVQCK